MLETWPAKAAPHRDASSLFTCRLFGQPTAGQSGTAFNGLGKDSCSTSQSDEAKGLAKERAPGSRLARSRKPMSPGTNGLQHRQRVPRLEMKHPLPDCPLFKAPTPSRACLASAGGCLFSYRATGTSGVLLISRARKNPRTNEIHRDFSTQRLQDFTRDE